MLTWELEVEYRLMVQFDTLILETPHQIPQLPHHKIQCRLANHRMNRLHLK